MSFTQKSGPGSFSSLAGLQFGASFEEILSFAREHKSQREAFRQETEAFFPLE